MQDFYPRPRSPFDASALERLRRMGLAGADGQADQDAMAVFAHIFCQRQFEIVRKRRRNFVVFRRGGNKNQLLPCSKRVFTICCF